MSFLATLVWSGLLLASVVRTRETVGDLLRKAGELLDKQLEQHDEYSNIIPDMPLCQAQLADRKPDAIVEEEKIMKIFHRQSSQGLYKLTFQEAKTLCESYDTTLASLNDLRMAWVLGYENCVCGWLSDASARYPMQKDFKGCGKIGINVCSKNYNPVLNNNRWDVFCKTPKVEE